MSLTLTYFSLMVISSMDMCRGQLKVTGKEHHWLVTLIYSDLQLLLLRL